jgi:hypothetical protein
MATCELWERSRIRRLCLPKLLVSAQDLSLLWHYPVLLSPTLDCAVPRGTPAGVRGVRGTYAELSQPHQYNASTPLHVREEELRC